MEYEAVCLLSTPCSMIAGRVNMCDLPFLNCGPLQCFPAIPYCRDCKDVPASRLQYPLDFAQGLIQIRHVFKRVSGQHEIELSIFIGQIKQVLRRHIRIGASIVRVVQARVPAQELVKYATTVDFRYCKLPEMV